MEVKRIGSYLEVDRQGFLESHADAVRIKGPWFPAVKAVKKAYLDRWHDNIHSIYIRGSVAKGLAIEGTSDIDSFAVLKPNHEQFISYDEFSAWSKTVEQRVSEVFPFVTGVELGLESYEEAQDRDNPFAFIIKVEAACVHGEHLAQRIGPYKPGPEIAFQTRYFRQHLDTFSSEYPKEPEQEKPEFLTWMMRRFLRLGMELVMTEERRYTRDLYLCYESFSKHYPEKAAEMYRALEVAINPTSGKATEAFARSFGGWLAQETEERLAAWGYVQSQGGVWVEAP